MQDRKTSAKSEPMGTVQNYRPNSEVCHTLVLSPIENQMRQAYAHAHAAKPWRQTKPRREQKVPKNKENKKDKKMSD